MACAAFSLATAWLMMLVGSNAAYRTLRADHLARVPPGLDAAEAAALIVSWTTALWRMRFKKLPGCASVLSAGRSLQEKLP
jgi:NADPH:quinone reductase-like Zn-dependent oxidoreductase